MKEVIMKENVTEFLKENYPGRAIQLEDKFKSVNVVLLDILRDLLAEAQRMLENKDYNQAMSLIETQKNVNELLNSNRKIISQLEIEDEQVQKEDNKRLRGNDEYLVNTDVPHGLNEDFRFKRPYAFSMGNHYQEVSTWKEMLVATCEYLNKLDPKKFESFADDKTMQWGQTYNFSKNKNLLRTGTLIEGSKVYVETSKDSIAVRQLIVKMLDRFELNTDDFKVFLRADYTDRRKEKAKSK